MSVATNVCAWNYSRALGHLGVGATVHVQTPPSQSPKVCGLGPTLAVSLSHPAPQLCTFIHPINSKCVEITLKENPIN